MKKVIDTCLWCGEHKPLIKAHIISHSLFKHIFKEYGRVHSVSVKNLDDTNLVQDAYYDTGILCHGCDNQFSPFENYFSNLIKKRFKINGVTLSEIKSYPSDQYSVNVYKGIDVSKIRMFYLILLWRASISKQESFKYISLPDMEDWLKTEIKNGATGDFDIFPTTIISFEDVDDIRTKGFVQPLRFNWSGSPILFFSLGSFALLYFLDGNDSTFLYEHRLKKNEDLQVVKLDSESGLILLDKITVPVRIKLSDFNPDLYRTKST